MKKSGLEKLGRVPTRDEIALQFADVLPAVSPFNGPGYQVVSAALETSLQCTNTCFRIHTYVR